MGSDRAERGRASAQAFLQIDNSGPSASACRARRAPNSSRRRARMAFLTGVVVILLFVGNFAIGVFQNLLASDIYDRCPRIALWLLSQAVATVPEDQRERYREEWSADLLTDCPTKLDQVRVALGVLWSARK